MPQNCTSVGLGCSAAEVFAFLASPANLVQLAPPELHLELLDGPPRLELGSVLRWQARRFGVRQTLVNEITGFEEGVLIEERQRHGPFRAWQLRLRFEPAAEGSRLVQELTYEPPGGMLGLLVRPAAVQADLEQLFAYRAEQLRQRLGG